MRVLIFHGYLLHGTGSNVYNANLAAALARQGHEVHMLCQERDPWSLDWVDAAGDWDAGALTVQTRDEPPGTTVYRPDIGGVLPVYVADVYEGFDARPFAELSEAEVEHYIEANVAAVRDVVARARPDVALANHLVMGPVILARALDSVPYAVKIHGSALEYTVKPHPRFLPYALEGIRGASGVLVGSRHTGESLWAALAEPGLQERTRLGPPGVDVERFAPGAGDIEGLRERLAQLPAQVGEGSFVRDPADAARALATIEPEDRLVVYVGKLIASKGVELLLAAWPLVLAREPRARLLVVGFGAFAAGLQHLADDLACGALDAVHATTGEDGQPLPWLGAFLDTIEDPEAYRRAAAAMNERIAWAGRLDHDELTALLPAAEAMVVPSTFPESFGMVAAEAAACGTLPIVARHSGLAEVASALTDAVPAGVRLTFDIGPGAVAELAEALSTWLDTPADVRAATRDAIVAVTRERWSWDRVARSVIAAAQGDLDTLPDP